MEDQHSAWTSGAQWMWMGAERARLEPVLPIADDCVVVVGAAKRHNSNDRPHARASFCPPMRCGLIYHHSALQLLTSAFTCRASIDLKDPYHGPIQQDSAFPPCALRVVEMQSNPRYYGASLAIHTQSM